MEISRLIDIQEVIFYEHSEYISLRDGDPGEGIRIILGSQYDQHAPHLKLSGRLAVVRRTLDCPKDC